MEIERIKFMLKSYLRTRVLKIEKFLIYLVEKDLGKLLSAAEMDYCWTLYESRKAHLKSEILDKIPDKANPLAENRDLPDKMSKFIFLTV